MKRIRGDERGHLTSTLLDLSAYREQKQDEARLKELEYENRILDKVSSELVAAIIGLRTRARIS